MNVGQRVKVFPTAAEYESYSGKTATILRELGDAERDLAEVGRMYEVEFEGGYRLQVFEDELN